MKCVQDLRSHHLLIKLPSAHTTTALIDIYKQLTDLCQTHLNASQDMLGTSIQHVVIMWIHVRADEFGLMVKPCPRVASYHLNLFLLPLITSKLKELICRVTQSLLITVLEPYARKAACQDITVLYRKCSD